MSTTFQVLRVCRNCGKDFQAKTTVTNFCSNRCSSANYKQRVRANKIEASKKETEQIKARPIELIKAKAYLSINDACLLFGVSRSTIYRLIEKSELKAGKAGSRTIIKRSDIEQLLFERPTKVPKKETVPIEQLYKTSDCYTMTEAQLKFGISESGLRSVVIRHKIPKIKKGRFAYIPKAVIEPILSN